MLIYELVFLLVTKCSIKFFFFSFKIEYLQSVAYNMYNERIGLIFTKQNSMRRETVQ